MKKWWNDKAWPWLKKNWKWILLPVGILLAIIQLMPRKRTLQASSELAGAAEVEREAEEEAKEEIFEAMVKKDESLKAIDKKHAEVIEKLTEEQKGKVELLREDPEELNSFLLDVGRNIRK